MLAVLEEAERMAGEAILTVYRSPVRVEHKADRSPVTDADRLSHEILTAALKRNYAYPVLSEEGKSIEYDERRRWETFWLVDPLDGTKEFINGNGEFTVNAALIRGGVPVMGAIYVPVKDLLYYAFKGSGAYRIENGMTVRLPLRTERRYRFRFGRELAEVLSRGGRGRRPLSAAGHHYGMGHGGGPGDR